MKKKIGFFLCLFMIGILQIYATDWFVRPIGGSYGAENGTSYENAWDGLKNITWGAGGVQPGDTLYVCGCHVHTMSSPSSFATQGDIPVISGTPGNEVTIRGDYSGDPGRVWGAYYPAYEAWANEGNNVYSITLKGGHCSGLIFEDIGSPNYDSYTLMTKAGSLSECEATIGTFYSDSYSRNSKLYVHCTDNGDPTGRVAINSYGYEFRIAYNYSYITFKNLELFDHYEFEFVAGAGINHITWDGCTIWYGSDRIITIRDGNDDITIKDCDIAYGVTGIYTISGGTDPPDRYTISGCRIHHCGYLPYHRGLTDPHAIGAQGGDGCIIENNEIYLCGQGIIWYIYANHIQTNSITSRNYIHDLFSPAGGPQIGISFGCNNDADADQTGNECSQNIVTGCTIGIYSKYIDQVDFFNNLCFDNDENYRFQRTTLPPSGKGVSVRFKNNISINPNTYHLVFTTTATSGNYKIDSNRNLFFPSTSNQFYFRDASDTAQNISLAAWQSLSRANCTFDPNSKAEDPLFSNDSQNDFHPTSLSPTIDTGEDVGLSHDIDGTPLPQGYDFDIGPYEFLGGGDTVIAGANASPSSGYVPLAVDFSGTVTGGSAPYTYNWDFGDGTSTTGQNPIHTFSTANSYTITLTVTDNNNNHDTDTIIITASQRSESLSASLSASPTSGTIPVEVNFSGSASNGTPPYSYSWDFGDGASSTDQSLAYTYAAAGSYNVVLTVTDNIGNQATDSVTIQASAPAHAVSTPDIPNSPSTGLPDVTYSYSTGGATCSQGHNIEYQFDWGDGTFSDWSTATSASHAWASSGTYILKARARCSMNTSVTSDWSVGKTVQISNTAQFSLALAAITENPAPGQGGTTDPVPGTYAYPSGNTASITAVPNTNYRFAKWSGDVSSADTYNDQINIAMNQNKTITAKFFTQCGDVNGDSLITPDDAQVTFDIFLGKLAQPTEAQKENADVNCDGTKTTPKVTPADAQAIFRKFLGKKELPGDCSCNSRQDPSTSSISSQSFSDITLKIDAITGQSGQEIVVPVIISGSHAVNALGFDLHYSSDILQFVRMESTTTSQMFAAVNSNPLEDGLIRIGGYTLFPIHIQSPRVLVKLIFKVVKDVDGSNPFTILNTVDDLKNARIKFGRLIQD